jgi:transposase-like protein
MLGFKRFRNAAATISGIELMHRIRKGQFNFSMVGLKDTAAHRTESRATEGRA